MARNKRTGPTTYRGRTWKIMFWVALGSCIVTAWVFSSLTQALLSGCPLNDAAYCRSEWRIDVENSWWAFLALLCASGTFMIVVLSLRCSVWYRGSKLPPRCTCHDKEFGDDECATIAASEQTFLPSPIQGPPAVYAPSGIPAEAPIRTFVRAPVEVLSRPLYEAPDSEAIGAQPLYNEKYRYENDIAKSPLGMTGRSFV